MALRERSHVSPRTRGPFAVDGYVDVLGARESLSDERVAHGSFCVGIGSRPCDVEVHDDPGYARDVCDDETCTSHLVRPFHRAGHDHSGSPLLDLYLDGIDGEAAPPT